MDCKASMNNANDHLLRAFYASLADGSKTQVGEAENRVFPRPLTVQLRRNLASICRQVSSDVFSFLSYDIITMSDFSRMCNWATSDTSDSVAVSLLRLPECGYVFLLVPCYGSVPQAVGLIVCAERCDLTCLSLFGDDSLLVVAATPRDVEG